MWLMGVWIGEEVDLVEFLLWKDYIMKWEWKDYWRWGIDD